MTHAPHTILIVAMMLLGLYYTGNLIVSLIKAYRAVIAILASILLRSVSIVVIIVVLWSLA